MKSTVAAVLLVAAVAMGCGEAALERGAVLGPSGGFGLAATQDRSSVPDVRVNTTSATGAGTTNRVMLWLSADWDAREVRIVCDLVRNGVRLEEMFRAVVPAHPDNGNRVDWERAGLRDGEYRCLLTRVDTPVNQTAVVTFQFGGDPKGSGGGPAPTTPGGGGGSNPPGGGGGDPEDPEDPEEPEEPGECAKPGQPFPEQPKIDCPPGHAR